MPVLKPDEGNFGCRYDLLCRRYSGVEMAGLSPSLGLRIPDPATRPPMKFVDPPCISLLQDNKSHIMPSI